MFKSLLLLILLIFSCKEPHVADKGQAQPRLLDQELDNYALALEENGDDFRLQLNKEGLVSISFLSLAGKEVIKNNVWQLEEEQENWRFAWKSWQGDQAQLLWLELMDTAKLREQKGFYLAHMGIPLQAQGDYSVEVKIFQDKEIIAEQQLKFKLNTQRYYGGGVGGQLRYNKIGVAASVFAVDPQQASVAFSQSNEQGHFYLKYKYSGNYRVFAFDDRSFVATQMFFRELQGSGKIYYDMELQDLQASHSQSWLLTGSDAEPEELTDSRTLELVLSPHTFGKAILIGALAKNGRLCWQYFDKAYQKMSLEIDSLVYNDPQAVLFVLQQGKVPFSRWLNKDLAADAAQSFHLNGQMQSFSVDVSTVKEAVDLQLDVSKLPDISLQRDSFVDAGSTLLLSASANSGIRSWRWFINGSFFGDDITTVYQVPDDHEQLFVRVKVDDHWDNTFSREYRFSVRKSGLIWEADTPAPYWLANHGFKEQKFVFRAKFIGDSHSLSDSQQRVNWYLEDASQPVNNEEEPDFSSVVATPFELEFKHGGFYRLRVELADGAENPQDSRAVYESEFLVHSPIEGLEIKGVKVAKALSQSQFNAVIANLEIQKNENKNLNYIWYLDDKLVTRFPEFIELSDGGESLIYHNKTLRMKPKEHLLRLEVNDGFYPETLQTEYSFSTEAVQASFKIVHEDAEQDPNYTYLLEEEQSFKAVFKQVEETIDAASLQYQWTLSIKEDLVYKKLSKEDLALWKQEEQQLILNFLQPGNYRLESVAVSTVADNELELKDELFFRVNSKLDALDFEFSERELSAAETLVLKAKITNIEAQILDQDKLSYRWFYWKDGQFGAEQRFELDSKNLAAGFRLISDQQLEFKVDPLLKEESEWQFQVEVSDNVYAEPLVSSKEKFRFKKSDWELSLDTKVPDHYRIERLFKVHAKLEHLASKLEQTPVYHWQLELFDTDKTAYRPALLKGLEAEISSSAEVVSLVFSRAGRYRLRCSVALKAYENEDSLRSQELIFEVNHPPKDLKLTAPSKTFKAGESLKIKSELANLETQIQEKDTLTYRWQQENQDQFKDINHAQLPSEFQFNKEKTTLQITPSVALFKPHKYNFRLIVKDSVYAKELLSNTLTIEVEPADIVLKVERLERAADAVFLVSQTEEFKAIVNNLPPSLSADSLSYDWRLQELDADDVYQDLVLKDADPLATSFYYTPTQAGNYRILLEGVYSDKEGLSRNFSSNFDFLVNHPLTDVQIKSSDQQVKAGESLTFTALIKDQEKQEGDVLSYRWQLKTTKGDFVDLSNSEQWTIEQQKLHFTPYLELAQKELKQIRVVVGDTHYPEINSPELTFASLPLDLVLSIEEPATPFKLDSVLTFSAKIDNLIPELSDFIYVWKVYDKANVEIDAVKIVITENSGKKFSLKFKESGDYRLYLKASFGVDGRQRELVRSLVLPINRPPHKLTLSSDKTAVKAGENVVLTALLDNVQEQLDEGDTLYYRWQLKTANGQGFQDLVQKTFPLQARSQDNTLQLSILPSLAENTVWQLRASIGDPHYQEIFSQVLELNLQAAAVKLDIIAPQGILKLGRHNFSVKVDNLPAALSYADLNYFWKLEQQDEQGAWSTQGYEAATHRKNIFTPIFKDSGDYRLQLTLSFGKKPFQRQILSEKFLHLDHPPKNLSLERLPAKGVIKAGEKITFTAVLENLEAQELESNSLTWLWERQNKAGSWQILQTSMLPTGSSINNHKLVYQLEPTLDSDDQVTLRLSLNDGVYGTTLSSKAVSFNYEAARLEPSLILPVGKHRINQTLVINSQFASEQLPRGIREKDLNYLWYVEQQDFNGDWRQTTQGFSVAQNNKATFRPTFSASGAYRLRLELSFKAGSKKRSFLASEELYLNHPPSRPVLEIISGNTIMKAGESLQLQATIANRLEQQQEQDSLKWIWSLKNTAGNWQILKTEGSTVLEGAKLSYAIVPTLAKDTTYTFRVQVSDALYAASAYSNEIVVKSKAVQLQPEIILPAPPHKVGTDLEIKALVNVQELPAGLGLKDLGYTWMLQTPEGLDAAQSFTAADSDKKVFQPQFQKSGDYRLQLSVSFGNGAAQRRFTSSSLLHLNHRPQTASLSSAHKEDFVKAGASFELSANIGDQEQQTKEQDQLSWIWQMKIAQQPWQPLSKLSPTLKIDKNKLFYRVPPTLKNDEERSFRVKLTDGVYDDAVYSQPLSLKLQASRLAPSIILPQGGLLIKKQLRFASKINNDNLPQGIELEQLDYRWTLEEREAERWQPLDKNRVNVVGSDNHSFGATFQESGDYRLRLSISFTDPLNRNVSKDAGKNAARREFFASKEIYLNQPPSTPMLQLLSGSESIKAGSSLQLQATIANQLKQQEEKDSLTWLWQMKSSTGNWQTLKGESLAASFSIKGDKLGYAVPQTLAQDESYSFRVQVSDSRYPASSFSEKLVVNFKAVQLEPQIILPAPPYKVDEDLKIEALIDKAQLPEGLSLKDLGYTWALQTSEGLEVSKSFRAAAYDQKIFQPQFKKSGDYRLQLSVSFGAGQNQRAFTNFKEFHINQPPHKLTLSSDKTAVKAGENVVLTALLDNVQEQLDEGDKLYYRWQLKTANGQGFQDLVQKTFPLQARSQDNTLQLSILPSLAENTVWQLRASIGDPHYQEIFSQVLELNLQAAAVKLDIIAPQGILKLGRHNFSVKVDNLPAALSYADLNYFWKLEQQDEQGAWSTQGYEAATHRKNIFTPIFKDSGDYRLQLTLSFGKKPFQRQILSEKFLHLDHPPKNLSLERLPAKGVIKAGEKITFTAFLENLEAQELESNSLTWLWERQNKAGSWQILQTSMLPTGSSINNHKLVYQLEPTLDSDDQVTLRLSLNDGVYGTTLSSKAVSFNYEAARLEPSLILPVGKHRINQTLVINSQFASEQLPRGIREKDLNYFWYVEQQDFNGDWRQTTQGFSVAQNNKATFRPTFSASGAYRLRLELSFKAGSKKRSFLASEELYLNHPPSRPVLEIISGNTIMKAGESLQLQATIANRLEQQQEQDSLKWIWSLKNTAGNWQILKTEGSTVLEGAKLSYAIVPTLAKDTTYTFRVQVSDALYAASAYSNEIVVKSKAVQLQPEIILPAPPHKVGTDLEIKALVNVQELPAGLGLKDLGYTWMLQTPEGLDAAQSFTAADSDKKVFQPQFQKSGDYRLQLSVSFGNGAAQRRFTSSSLLHLNHRPQTASLSSAHKEDFVKAGASFELSANIGDQEQQTKEQDQLSWIWQMKIAQQPWQPLSKLSPTLKIDKNKLFYRVPPTLKNDEERSFRVKLTDGVYDDAVYSQPLSLKLQASRLAPSIILPQGGLLIKKQLRFASKINNDNLPQGIELEQLDYRWTLEEREAERWQPLDKNRVNVVGSDNHSFGATFQESGDYRLRLSISFSDPLNRNVSKDAGKNAVRREFFASKEIYLNQPPSTPMLQLLSGSESIKAGSSLQLQATIANQLKQQEEKDSLTWLWQMKSSTGNWQTLKGESLAASFSIKGDKLGYAVPQTLAQDESCSFRVQVSDSRYPASSFSEKLVVNFKAVQLEPQIILPAPPYKVDEDLKIEALIDKAQLPEGLSLKDLGYTWTLQTSEGLEVSKSFRAAAYDQKIFQPQFKKSGDYRLQLSVSFGAGQNQRTFTNLKEFHINQPPHKLTLSSDKTAVKAGENVVLTALLDNVQEQLDEGDTLYYRWQLKTANGQGFQDLVQKTFPLQARSQDNTLQLSILPSLAENMVWQLRASIGDPHYQEIFSQVLELNLQAAAVKLDIIAPQGILKLGRHNFSVKVDNLPAALSYADLNYFWKLEQQDEQGAWSTQGYEAATHRKNIFTPIFKDSGDYRLQLTLSFGKKPFQRQILSEKFLHLDHPPKNLSLERLPAKGVIKAGEKITFTAVLENLEAQELESNSLTWLWERQNKAGSWQILQTSMLPTGSSINNHKLVYQLEPTLDSDDQVTLRLSLNDGVYGTTLSSKAVSFNYEAARLEPSLILPVGKHRINQTLVINSQFASEQLPRGIREKDLNYLWYVEQQDFNGDWRQTTQGFSVAQNNKATFRPTFSASGAYRLRLELSFKAGSKKRSFLASEELYLNHPPSRPVLEIISGNTIMKAGESLQLQATIANRLEQQQEQDSLKWIWSLKNTAGNWQILKTEGSTVLEGAKLSYAIVPTLAKDTTYTFRVQVSDALYAASAYSNEIVVKSKAVQLQPEIILPAPPHKVGTDLEIKALVNVQELPAGLGLKDLGYTWMLQTPEGLDAAQSFTAADSDKKVFQPQFQKSGDYRLQLSVSFGNGAAQRRFTSSSLLHLNHRPQTASLSSAHKEDFVKAGASFELSANIGDQEQQTKEQDQLSWIWQMKIAQQPWQPLSKLSPMLKIDKNKLFYRVPPTLKNDEERSFRVKLTDGVYDDAVYSQPLSLKLQASRLAPSIILPQGGLLIKKQLRFASKINNDNLPQGIELEQLDYRWTLEEREAERWQPLDKNRVNVVGSDNHSFGATFQESGDYRLRLSISFTDPLNRNVSKDAGKNAARREFFASKEIYLNQPPSTPMLQLLSGSESIKAGSSLQLQATIANQLKQQEEKDSLTWLWQMKSSTGNWQTLKGESLAASFSIKGDKLGYAVPQTLAQDESYSFRVQVSDSRYPASSFSEKLVVNFKAVQLEPQIILPAPPYKVDEDLKIEALIDKAQLPEGLSLKDLGYTWALQTSEGLEVSKSFRAAAYDQKIFQPQFKKSGDYRLQLSVSFGAGQNQRTFTNFKEFHINHPPESVNLKIPLKTVKAGERLLLQAKAAATDEQEEEGDSLLYRWRYWKHGQTGDEKAISLDLENLPAGFSSSKDDLLELQVDPALSNDEQWHFQVAVKDRTYASWLWSKKKKVMLSRSDWLLSLTTPAEKKYILEHLYPVDALLQNLPPGLKDPLKYEWTLQVKNKKKSYRSARLLGNRAEAILMPQDESLWLLFSEAAAYRVTCKASFKSHTGLESVRTAYIDFRLNAPPQDVTLSASKMNLEAGKATTFNANLANLAEQNAEGDQLSYRWQQGVGGRFHDIVPDDAEFEFFSKTPHKINFTPAAALAQTKMRIFRVLVQDDSYTRAVSSPLLFVVTEPAEIKLSIEHLSKSDGHVFTIAKEEKFKAIVENLPNGITEQSYQWQLQIAKDGIYLNAQQGAANKLTSNSIDYIFTLKSAADYRLLLKANYKDYQAQRRFFERDFKFRVNHPPAKVEILGARKNVRAGKSLKLQALLRNLHQQQGDSISYTWQEEVSQGVFHDMSDGQQWSFDAATLILQPPLHLAAAEEKSFRVLVNDGHYASRASEVVKVVMQPLELSFEIQVPDKVLKINEALTLKVDYKDFPQELNKDTLNYSWQVLQKNGDENFKEVASKWRATSSKEKTFHPLFKEGGDFIIRLRLSYGSNNEQRILRKEQAIKINHPPGKLVLKSNVTEIVAAETLILTAHLADAELQKKEGDRLSYSWQQRRADTKTYKAVQSSVLDIQKKDGQLSLVIEPGIASDEKWEFIALVDDGHGQKSVSEPLLLTFKAANSRIEIKNPSGTLLSKKNYNFIAQLEHLPQNLEQNDLDYTWSIEREQSKNIFIKSDHRDLLINGGKIKENILTTQFLHGGKFRLLLKVGYGKKIKRFIETVSEVHINYPPSALKINFEPRLSELQVGSRLDIKLNLANLAEQKLEGDPLVWTWMFRHGDQPFIFLDTTKSNTEFHFNSEQWLRYTPSIALKSDEKVEFRVAVSDAHYQSLSSQKSLQLRALSIEPTISLLKSVPKLYEELSFQALIPENKVLKDNSVSYHWQVLQENEKGEWKAAKENLYQLKNGNTDKNFNLSFQKHGEFTVKLKVSLSTGKDKTDFIAEQLIWVNKPPALPQLLGAPVTTVLEAGETLQLRAEIADEVLQNQEGDILSWLWQMKKDTQEWEDLSAVTLADELRIKDKTLSYRVPLTLKDDEFRSFRVRVDDGVYADHQLSKSVTLQFKAVKLQPKIVLPSPPYKVDQTLNFQAFLPQSKVGKNQLLNYEWVVEKETAQGSWQKIDLHTLQVEAHNEKSLQVTFLNAGRYRLKLLVSVQEGEAKREFSALKEIWLNYPPAQLILERQPATGDIFGGEKLSFLSKMSNLANHIDDDKDQLAWTWQRAIIPVANTLKEDDFELLKHKGMEVSYTPSLSQNKEKKLYYRLAFSDGVYEVKKVMSKAVLLKPLPIKIKILSDTEDAELLKYRPNKGYEFKFALEPQLPPSVDINYEWSLLNGENVITSQRKEPQFSFNGHTKYKLSLLLSYTSEGRKRQLNPKTIRININAPPRGVTFHAQQIKDSGQRVSIDTNKYKMLEVASSDKLVLIPTIANLEKQKKEGDKISYRWFEKSSTLKNRLVLAQFMPVDLAKEGYEQNASGVLAIDAAKIDLEGKKYRTFSCEAQDDAYQEWKRSVVSLRTNFQITPTNLELKTSMNGHIKSISQNNAQPSPITTLEKTDYSASLYDPDSLIRSLTLKNPRQVHGILVFSKDLRASGGGKLKISRQLKLDSPDKDGYRHAHFQLSVNRSSALNIALSLIATGSGKKLQSKFYLQRIDAQPYDIELFQGNTKMSHQRAHPSIIPVNSLSGLNSNFTKISHFSLHFKDPNDLVKRHWKLELIEGQQAMLLGNSPYKDIIYSLNSNGKNDEKDGLRHITFNFGFKERSWQGKILQIRASLSSDQGQSYPISKDFYIQRDFFIPSEWKFFEQKAHGLAEEIPSQRIIMKHSQTKEFFVQIKDPDKQIRSLELLSSPVWGDIPTKKVEFGDILDHEGHRRSKLFEISVIANIGKDNTLHFKLHSVSGAIKTPQQAEKSFIITNN